MELAWRGTTYALCSLGAPCGAAEFQKRVCDDEAGCVMVERTMVYLGVGVIALALQVILLLLLF
jgi:hypothetical protein